MLASSLRGDVRVRARLRQALADHDPAAVEAARREAARRGAPPPDDLLDEPLARPGRVVDLDLPLDVWAELPDGRTLRVGSTPCLGGVDVPPHLTWWVTPTAPIEPDDLADAVERAEVAGLALDGREARAQLAAVAARRPASLRRLSVTTDHLGPALLGQVAALPGLEALTLHDRLLTDEGLRALAPATGLRELSVREGAFDDAALAALAALTRLRRLELTGTRWLEGPGLGVVARLPRLERLSLAGAHALRGDAPAELAVAPRLRALDLCGCAVDAWGLRPLVRGPVADVLRELRLGCYTLNDELVGLIADLRELEALRLGGARLGDGAVAAAAALPRLRRLELDAYDATDAGLARLGSATLERLHLAAPGAELEALAGVIRRCPSLRRLGLACRPVDEEVLAALTGCAALEELELGLNEGSDLRLLAPLPRLRRLTLSGKATLRDLEALRFGFGALCELSLDVTCTPSNALEALTALPRLEVLRLLDRELGDTCPCRACEARLLTHGAREAALASLARDLPDVDLVIRGRTPR